MTYEITFKQKNQRIRASCHRAENSFHMCPYIGTDYVKVFEFKVLIAAS